MRILFNLTKKELEEFVISIGEEKFRANQIYNWLNIGAHKFDYMKNLPINLINKLKTNSKPFPINIVKELNSSDLQTTKFLLELEKDKQKIESVLMRTSYGNSVCISSQVGCAMGCKFCASTLLGLKRNLSINEMFTQVLVAGWKLHDNKFKTFNGDINNNDITHVVVMGTGEPLENIDNLIGFIEKLHIDMNIGWRKITVSTCGIIEGIKKLTDWGRPINLAISLHAPNDEIRNKIMPINFKYKINEVLESAFEFVKKNNRQLMIEYILLDGINNSESNALELVGLLKNKNCMVNLIPWNKVKERNFKEPSGNSIHRFQDVLIKNGLHVRIRKERGSDIKSACGQLRIENS